MTFQQILDRITELSNYLCMMQMLRERPPGVPDDADLNEVAHLTDRELDRFVRSLPVGVLYRLLIVLYMAKRYFENPTFLDAYEDVSRRFPKPHWAMEELLDDPPLLADRLDYGLRLLHRHGVFMHEFEGSWKIEAKK